MSKVRKPQYRTLVTALDELTMAVNKYLMEMRLGPNRDLAIARNHAEELVQRAQTALAERKEAKDANQRWDTGSNPEHGTSVS